jgi:hypothetical protein
MSVITIGKGLLEDYQQKEQLEAMMEMNRLKYRANDLTGLPEAMQSMGGIFPVTRAYKPLQNLWQFNQNGTLQKA